MIPPSVTFFDHHGLIDEAWLRAHIEWLLEAGVRGLLGVGTCGEFSGLEVDERERVAERLVHAAGDTPVYIGVAHTSTRMAVRLAKHAQHIGASGVVGVGPYYSSPPEREVLAYFRDIADAVDIPLVVYNDPRACRAARRASVSNISASRPATSPSSGSWRRTLRVRRMAWAVSSPR